ncbi:hypothetical protein [Geobacter sp.]|uniref:hypothetical protein n=1 Tax=Geobacter sp. TaxID=46610 RepID=UPI002613085D|nr:hypothetical protein [Geobacter sp.]
MQLDPARPGCPRCGGSFDAAYWQAAIRKELDQVQEAYPAGCLDWLRENVPGRILELKATVEEAKRAYLAQDAQALEAALSVYRSKHMETFDEFRRESE